MWINKEELNEIKEQIKYLQDRIVIIEMKEPDEKYIGEVYIDGTWLSIKGSDIKETIEDNVKIFIKDYESISKYLSFHSIDYPSKQWTSHSDIPNYGKDVWVKKSQIFYYDDIYNPTRAKIEAQFTKKGK